MHGLGTAQLTSFSFRGVAVGWDDVFEDDAMAFFDFVRQRDLRTATLEDAKPETRKVEELPAHVKAHAVEVARPVAQLMERATSHRSQANVHADDFREALIRNQGYQGKEQSALSPTDHGRSQAVTQERNLARSRGIER
jgi:hypothetical protein